MSGRAWTPGPWEANHNDIYWTIDSERDGQIGDACASNYIYRGGVQLADVEAKSIAAANARLIAAAPDLFEALALAEHAIGNLVKPASAQSREDIIMWAESLFLPTARAALAKAEASHG